MSTGQARYTRSRTVRRVKPTNLPYNRPACIRFITRQRHICMRASLFMRLLKRPDRPFIGNLTGIDFAASHDTTYWSEWWMFVSLMTRRDEKRDTQNQEPWRRGIANLRHEAALCAPLIDITFISGYLENWKSCGLLEANCLNISHMNDLIMNERKKRYQISNEFKSYIIEISLS